MPFVPPHCSRLAAGLLLTAALADVAVAQAPAPPPILAKPEGKNVVKEEAAKLPKADPTKGVVRGPQTPALASYNLPTDFVPYTAAIPGTALKYKMVPIPGGTYSMGSPAGEKDREEHEGPQVQVTVKPFWMGVYEITWDEFDQYAFKYDIKAGKEAKAKDAAKAARERLANDVLADAVSRPTPPYTDMTFGYGHDQFPAICMTQKAAAGYCEWLTAKTGRPYRLPTEAEWEWACRAGTTTRYFFGDDPAKLGDYAWFEGNSDEKPHPIGQKKPSPWGLHDIHGNVNEWTQDKWSPEYFKTLTEKANGAPLVTPVFKDDEQVFFAARGGAYRDEPPTLRSAYRVGEEADWKVQDPQNPKSVWWLTDAHFVGFRLVRPYEPVAPALTQKAAPRQDVKPVTANGGAGGK